MAKSASGRRQAAQPVLDAGERERLVEQIEQEKAYRKGLGHDLPEGGHMAPMGQAGQKSIDETRIDKKIRGLEHTLELGTPKTLKGDALTQAKAEIEILEKWLPDHMLTQKEMDLFPRHGYEYSAAVRKSVKSEAGNPEFTRKANRYRELQAQLHPDDPEATSLEKLRKPR